MFDIKMVSQEITRPHVMAVSNIYHLKCPLLKLQDTSVRVSVKSASADCANIKAQGFRKCPSHKNTFSTTRVVGSEDH